MWGAPQALRAAGAAKAMGKQPAAKPNRPNNAKPMRMPSQHNAPASRPPQMRNANHPQGKGPAHAGPQSYLEMNPAQLQHFATKQVQGETKTGLAPYQQKAGEITGTEQTVAKRFGGYGEATDKLLGGLQSGAEGSAKTYGNMAADAALKAQSQVQGVGAQSQQQNAGYLDPQVANTLKEQQANITGIGASRQAGAETLGQSEQNLLTNMRAAAAQRVTEGQQGIASTFGKQRAQNQAGENALLARQPGAISKLQTELTQKAFNAKATEQGLGIKIAGVQQKGQEGAANRAQKEAASQRTAAVQQEGHAIQKWAKEADLTFKEAHPPGVKSPKPPKAPSPAEGRKYMTNISKAESVAQQQLGAAGKTDHARQEQVRKYLEGLGYSGDQVSAAMNLAVFGRLGPKDRQVAEAYGLTPKMRASWFAKGKGEK